MSRPCLLIALAALGCNDPPGWEGTWDIPEATAVLPVEQGGLFQDPVGYAASLHGGQVAVMDLRKGVYLADQPAAAFVRASPLPTGRDRIVAAVAPYAPDAATVEVYVADRAFGQLLRVPHITGLDDAGLPLRFEPTATEPVFVDADDSGDLTTVEGLRVRLGYTSTEDWTLTYDGEAWSAFGSRSGRQEYQAVFDEDWAADKRAIELTLRGTASEGDRIEISTDSGIEEIDLGGMPTQLLMAPDQSRLAASVFDTVTGTASLQLLDPATATAKETVALPAGAMPGRMAWSLDAGTLYVADLDRPAAYAVERSGDGVDAVVEYPLPWPVSDVAPLSSDDKDWLWVTPTEGRSVWIVDLRTGDLVDMNPLQDGVNGMDFDTLVRGLEAMPLIFQSPQPDDDGIRIWTRAVAVSLYTGRVVFMREADGCLVQDPLGPRTNINQQSTGNRDYTTNFSSSGGPFLEANATNDRSVLVNRCAGIARRETWSATYRREKQAWEVEGSRSGVQQRLAYEDERYISDDGAVSFTIRGGVLPTEEGWRIAFVIIPGALEANGDNDADGVRDVDFDLPADPVFFHHDTIEQREDGWLEVRDSPFVLVSASAGDLVGRVNPRNGDVQVAWW